MVRTRGNKKGVLDGPVVDVKNEFHGKMFVSFLLVHDVRESGEGMARKAEYE